MSAIRVLLLVVLAAAPAAAAELKTLKGQSYKGELVALSDKEIVFEADGQKLTIPLEEVVLLTLRDGADKLGPDVVYSEVELVDGTQLRCARVSLSGNKATLKLLGGQELALPVAKVTSILNEANKDENRKDWKEKVLSKKKARDILLARSMGAVNPFTGTLGDADAKGERIEFTRASDGQKGTVALDTVVGMYFQRGADATLKTVRCRLHDAAQNLLFATSVARTDDGFKVTLSCDLTIEYAKEKVVKLDYSQGKLTFLSSLNPVSEKESSVFGKKDVVSYRRDQNFDGGEIRFGSETFTNGLVMHATTELEYDLEGGEYRELRATAGIDDIDEETTEGEGPTVLKVFGDEQELLSLTFSRADKERTKPLVVPIKDVKKLKIVVTYREADKVDVGKRLALANARVQK